MHWLLFKAAEAAGLRGEAEEARAARRAAEEQAALHQDAAIQLTNLESELQQATDNAAQEAVDLKQELQLAKEAAQAAETRGALQTRRAQEGEAKAKSQVEELIEDRALASQELQALKEELRFAREALSKKDDAEAALEKEEAVASACASDTESALQATTDRLHEMEREHAAERTMQEKLVRSQADLLAELEGGRREEREAAESCRSEAMEVAALRRALEVAKDDAKQRRQLDDQTPRSVTETPCTSDSIVGWSAPPECPLGGHSMVFCSAAYAKFLCSRCGLQGTGQERWHCIEHQEDLCQTCAPPPRLRPPSPTQTEVRAVCSRAFQAPACPCPDAPPGHHMVFAVGAYAAYACSRCGVAGEDRERWLCAEHLEDLCLLCEPPPRHPSTS